MSERTWANECPNPRNWLGRIAASIEESPQGCWVWTKSLDRYGYGSFVWFEKGQRRGTGAHRASWLAHRSDIPEGLVIDHLCRNRACVNPWHMELVTNRVNTARGWAAAGPERVRRSNSTPHRQPGCKKHGREDGGVSFDGRGPHFKCRICGRERAAVANARRKSQRLTVRNSTQLDTLSATVS